MFHTKIYSLFHALFLLFVKKPYYLNQSIGKCIIFEDYFLKSLLHETCMQKVAPKSMNCEAIDLVQQ